MEINNMPKLLVVDDEEDIREFARSFFKRRGVEVLTASGGLEALSLIEKEKPELVLLDVRMEQMTGIEVLRKIRERNLLIKVIMVTGVEDEETVKEAKGLGVIGYVHKPLILDELEQVVLKELKHQIG